MNMRSTNKMKTLINTIEQNNKNNSSYQYQLFIRSMQNKKMEHSSHIDTKDQAIINPNTDSAVIAKKSFTISDDQHRYQYNQRIQNAQEIPNSHLHSKILDEDFKISANYFGKKANANRSLKRTNGANNSNQHGKLRESYKYKTLKNNDNIKRLQRLYTDNSGNSQLHSRLLMPTAVQQSYLHKSLHESLAQQQQKPSQQYNRQHPPNLSKQELYEENMRLKNTVNELKDTLNRQKIQTELQKKKNKKYTLQLNREFKKQLYYNNAGVIKAPEEIKQEERIAKLYTNQESDPENEQLIAKPSPFSQMMPKMSYYRMPASLAPPTIEPHTSDYMIAGIKQKYEQLRAQHQKVLNELKRIKAIDSIKKLEQISVYCSTLEDSNYKLATALQVAKKKLVAYENPWGQPLEGKNKDMQMYAEAVILEMSGKLQTLRSKNAYIKQQNKKLKQQQKQHEKLIRYLQVLISSKSTLLYTQQRSLKKTSSTISSLQLELNAQKKGSEIMQKSFMHQMQEISEKYENKLKEQKQLFQEALIEKNLQIKKLQKQIGYLSMIVENWKGNDDKEKQKDQVQEASVTTKKNRKESTLYGNFKIDLDKSNDPNTTKNQIFKYTERRELQKEYDQKVMQMASHTNRQQLNSRQEQLSKSNTQKDKFKIQQRVRKSSGYKHSQQGKKSRRVPIEQIIDLAEFIRYRLIGSKLSIDEAMQLLNFSNTESQVLIQEAELKWKNKYISQFQLVTIFESAPFKVSSTMSLLLSRYVIQDQCFYQNGNNDNAFVYIDPNNEIQRIIAKSILKAFIQSISTNFISINKNGYLNDVCQKQWGEVVEKTGSKINTPLISIAPSGFITKERWNELLTSLNVQINENVRQWCIGRMLIESESLSKLKYRVIVPDYM